MFHSPWGKITPYTQKAQKNMNVSFSLYDKGDWNSWLPKGFAILDGAVCLRLKPKTPVNLDLPSPQP